MTPSDRAAIEDLRDAAPTYTDAKGTQFVVITLAHRAILLALAERAVPREPTEAMLETASGWPVSPVHPHLGLGPSIAADIWRAMHDAATDQPAQEKPMDGIATQVFAEVERAIKKFPTWPTDPLHALAERAVWVSVADRMPDTDEPVFLLTRFGPAIDQWRMQYEAPVSFSSATIPTGVYWDNHDFEDVTHWMRIPAMHDAATDQPAGGEG